MNFIGIDFSINSPGMCIINDDCIKWISFFNIGEKNVDNFFLNSKIPKGNITHLEISKLDKCEAYPYNRRKPSNDYIKDSQNKLEDACKLADIIIDRLPKNGEVWLEGYSYGSKGNSFIDLIFFNAILRSKIYEKTDLKLNIASPSQVKKYAGIGNANKEKMQKFFLERQDKELIESTFFKYVLSLDEVNIKPIDDLIDAFFLASYGRSLSVPDRALS